MSEKLIATDLWVSQAQETIQNQQAEIDRLKEQRDKAIKAVIDIIEWDNYKSGYELIAEIEAGK